MLNLKVVDYRYKPFTDQAVTEILEDVASGRFWQVQVLCDSQLLCDAARSRIMRAAMDSGKQFELTILGGGQAVGVKLHIPAQYVMDPATGKTYPRDEWVKNHPGTA